jgi:DNA-binding transcriptional LysR family regulator
MRKLGIAELEGVIALAKRRSFRAAAMDVGVSPTALSQMIAGVEARLGVRLFNRTTRSVALTSAGTQFVAEIEPALGRIHDAIGSARDDREQPAGSVRINCAIGAARRILSPILLPFARRYPDIQIDLVTEDRLIDIVAEGFDAGVRPSDVVPGDMIALPLEPMQRFTVVASPDYLAGRAIPQTPRDLMEHVCIRARMPSGSLYRWEFEQDGKPLRIDVPGQITLNAASLMLEAALAGMGLTYLAEWWTEEHIAAGRLCRVLEDFTPCWGGLALYYPSRRYQPAALRALTSFIVEQRREAQIRPVPVENDQRER